MKAIESVISQAWVTFAAMSPYLIFGFAAAGLLSAFVSAGFVRRHLGGSGLWPIIKASALGVPLPLCSCSVIPVAMSLRINGASNAATVAFLLSTPQTGVDSILVTVGLLGPVFGIIRPVTALITGLVGGLITEFLEGQAHRPQIRISCCHAQSQEPTNRFYAAVRHGFVTLPGDIGKPLLVGLAIAAIISSLVPDDFFTSHLGKGIWPMLVMMAVGVPVYVCATASVPMAAAMIMKGLSPGAALVFLMTGPATNAAGLSTIWRTLGPRAAGAYLAAVGVCALASGLLLDWAVATVELPLVHRWHWMPGRWIEQISALVLVGVIVAANVPRQWFKAKAGPLGQ